jgi:biotin operon repressor
MIKTLALINQNDEVVEYVSVRQVAKELGISTNTINVLLRKQGIEPFRIEGNGRINYILKTDYAKYKEIRFSNVRSRMAHADK